MDQVLGSTPVSDVDAIRFRPTPGQTDRDGQVIEDREFFLIDFNRQMVPHRVAATDDSLIFNQLWHDHKREIVFLPGNYNVSVLQNPGWARNQVMQSFIYDWPRNQVDDKD